MLQRLSVLLASSATLTACVKLDSDLMEEIADADLAASNEDWGEEILSGWQQEIIKLCDQEQDWACQAKDALESYIDSYWETQTITTNFNGRVIDTSEAKLAREWNERASTGEFDDYNYRKYRSEMTKFGLPGSNWHVGHIYPNEAGSGRDKGDEDLGWNLKALDRYDNIKLGNAKVPDDMLEFWHRSDPN